jgi:hypothetical protein
MKSLDQLQYTLMLRTFEEYSANNVTVTVVWIQQVGAVYNSSVLPPAPLMFVGGSSLQLVLEYNTVYNLSVIMDIAPCGVSTETFIALSYGETHAVGRLFGNSHALVLCIHITMEEHCVLLISANMY